MQISKGVRRQLRRDLGTRATRRSGTKTRLVSRAGRPERASTRLKRAIRVWLSDQETQNLDST